MSTDSTPGITGNEAIKLLKHALTCAESITEFIVATLLVYPDKKIAGVKSKSLTG